MEVTRVEFSSKKDECLEILQQDLADWLEAIGQDAAHTAAEKAPVGTPESTGIPHYIGGTLKNSISWATQAAHGGGDSKPLATPEKNAVYIGSNVHYAPYQEFGTSRGIKGKHYIQFGATAHAADYGRLLEQILKQ